MSAASPSENGGATLLHKILSKDRLKQIGIILNRIGFPGRYKLFFYRETKENERLGGYWTRKINQIKHVTKFDIIDAPFVGIVEVYMSETFNPTPMLHAFVNDITQT